LFITSLSACYWPVFAICQNGPFKKNEAKPLGLARTSGSHFRNPHKPIMIPSPGNQAMLPGGGFEMRIGGGVGMRNGGGFRMRISGGFCANTHAWPANYPERAWLFLTQRSSILSASTLNSAAELSPDGLYWN
jgi:hypothetical protein